MVSFYNNQNLNLTPDCYVKIRMIWSTSEKLKHGVNGHDKCFNHSNARCRIFVVNISSAYRIQNTFMNRFYKGRLNIAYA